jgi:hypothetical protein
VKKIIQYLKNTSNYGPIYKKNSSLAPVAYADADHGGNNDDRKSTSGIIIKMANGPVIWRTKKQSVVALSTTEAEFISLTMVAREVIWLKNLLKELQLFDATVCIFGDNQGSIALAKNPVLHDRSKHFEIKFHFIRDHIKKETFNVEYIRSEEMLADLLTKPLPSKQTVYLCKKINLI